MLLLNDLIDGAVDSALHEILKKTVEALPEVAFSSLFREVGGTKPPS